MGQDRIKLMIIPQQLCIIIQQDRMGSCAGFKNPQRRYRTQGNQLHREPTSQQKPYQLYSPSPIVNSNSNQKFAMDVLRAYIQPASPINNLMKTSTKDPWKSRIGSKSITKYERTPTIKEQEQSLKKQNNFNVFGPKSIQDRSFDQSVIPKQEINRNQFQPDYSEKGDQINQMLFNSSVNKKYMSPTLSMARRMKTEEYSPAFDQQDISDKIKVSSYLPRKIDKHKSNHLALIMELVQKDAETPSYVKELKKQQGEDIKMNNFNRFQPVGSFDWFSLGKYLGQIQKAEGDESIEKMDGVKRGSYKYPVNQDKQYKLQKYETHNPDYKKKAPPNLFLEDPPQPQSKIAIKIK